MSTGADLSTTGQFIDMSATSCRSHRHERPAKLWGDMTAHERLRAKIDYLSYNYGEGHPLTVAARAGDLAKFRLHARHITEMMDVVVVGIVESR